MKESAVQILVASDRGPAHLDFRDMLRLNDIVTRVFNLFT